MNLLPLIGVARAAEADVSWGCFGTGNAVGYLLLVLMLLLLLLLRVHRREESRFPGQQERPEPETLVLLGKRLFLAIEKMDVTAYRNLFLIGAEIPRALGTAADDYLATRQPGLIERSMLKIQRRVPPGAVYDGAFMVGRDGLAIRLLTASGRRPTVIVGTVTKVDGIYRMVHPAFVDPPKKREAGGASEAASTDGRRKRPRTR